MGSAFFGCRPRLILPTWLLNSDELRAVQVCTALFFLARKNRRMNYYNILGVNFDANDAEIRAAYRAKALRFHPDKNMEQRSQAEVRFKLIHEAYNTLSDPNRRRKYDATYAHRPVKVHDDDSFDVEIDEFGIRVHDMSIHNLADLNCAFETEISEAVHVSNVSKAN